MTGDFSLGGVFFSVAFDLGVPGGVEGDEDAIVCDFMI